MGLPEWRYDHDAEPEAPSDPDHPCARCGEPTSTGVWYWAEWSNGYRACWQFKKRRQTFCSHRCATIHRDQIEVVREAMKPVMVPLDTPEQLLAKLTGGAC